MIRFQETNIKIQTILEKGILPNEQIAQTNNEGQLLFTRNAPVSTNNLQDTNHSVISISLDEQIEQNNDKKQPDTHNEIEENDSILRNEYQDTNSFGNRYLAIHYATKKAKCTIRL